MDGEKSEEIDNEPPSGEDTRSQSHESDTAWQLTSASEEECLKWKQEKERYDEIIEYIREVEDILNLMRPFPRDEPPSKPFEIQRQDSRTHSGSLDHLENIIKLVEQLKELQENNSKFGDRTIYLKDLRKLREHKTRLKNEEQELRKRTRIRQTTSPEDVGRFKSESQEESVDVLKNRKYDESEVPKDGWQGKRKSVCLSQKVNLSESKAKVSKWTKVKEAFHWEKASHSGVNKPKKESSTLQVPDGNKALDVCSVESDSWRDHSPDDGSSVSGVDGFPLPPPPPAPMSRSEDFLSVRPVQDLPSSSSSDKIDEFASFSEAMKGRRTSDQDLSSQVFPVDDADEAENPTRKSSKEEFTGAQMTQHLCKDEFASSRLTKSNKTTWGKVKDIIQTRKDSLKKKPKKRGSDEFKKRRKLSTLSVSQISDQFEDLSSPEEKPKTVESTSTKTVCESREDPSTGSEEKVTRRLMPALTITLPSTEELRSFSSDELEKRDRLEEEKANLLSQFSCQAQYYEDKSKYGKSKSGQNQRLSRWIKVKRVFLTSGSPSRPTNYLTGSSSSPTSQNKSSGFFSDMESDELSSGEWIDDKSPSQEKLRMGDVDAAALTWIQEDIRKSYNELQSKLNRDFDQKLREWETKVEAPLKQEDLSPKPREDGDIIPRFPKNRDSIPMPLPNLNDLSPEFKKKLNDWKKMKTSQNTSPVSSPTTKEDVQGQNIKIKIGEWQPWRNRCSQKGNLSDELAKKSEDGQKVRSRRKDDDVGLSGGRDSKRRESDKKTSHGRLSSGEISSTDKDGRFIRRAPKVKDFQWVEKELQKIEREKVRLEQEKEKYLEREARLEQMKRTMGTTFPTQEILVRTPTGFIRFKGISQKFTKKLYEWEKARGIAPEASTFALLEESAKTSTSGSAECERIAFQRSKSMGSVPELSALIIQTMAHHPSSLSLNDVDELKTLDKDDDIGESISSRQIKVSLDDNDEPEAIIVDVEDIIDETAIEAESPSFKSEIPVYTFASEDINQSLDSSGRFSCPSFDIKIMGKNEDGGKQSELFETETVSRKSKKGLGEEKAERDECEDDLRKNLSDVAMSFAEEQEETKQLKKASFQDQTQISSSSGLQTFRSEGKFSQTPQKEEKTLEAIQCEALVPTTLSAISREDSPPSSKPSARKTHEEQRPRGSKESPKSRPKESKTSHESKNDSEAIKKKIKEKITLMQRMTTEPKVHNWKVETDRTNAKTGEKSEEQRKGDKTEFENKEKRKDRQEATDFEASISCESRGSVNVFVPTTRKIIFPVKTSQGKSPSVYSYVIDDVKPEQSQEKTTGSENIEAKETKKMEAKPTPEKNDQNDFLLPSQGKKKPENESESEKRDIGMPPLPNSPKSFKKLNPKETAPSIRMIIAKYNQKISEHDSNNEKRAEGGSPIWTSPVFGRRTQEKIERYTRKEGGGYKKNGEVQKSASFDTMRSIPSASKPVSPQEARLKGILKSSSMGVMKNSEGSKEPLSLDATPEVKVPKEISTSPSALRAMKIQKAKEDFLSGKLATSCDATITTTPQPRIEIEDTDKPNEPDDECELVKSVSSETISSEKTQSEGSQEKSLESRTLQKSSSKFDISSIKSKFRKMRMKKDKETKMNAVATLCRQSLLIEVPTTSGSGQPSASLSKSCPSSPVMDRSKMDQSRSSGRNHQKGFK